MATQTVLHIPSDASFAASNSEKAVKRNFPHMRKSVGVLAFFAVVIMVEAAVPRLRYALVQMPMFLVPVLVSFAFQCLRDLCPTRVPAALAPGSPQLLKLVRIQKTIGWTAFGTLALGIVGLLAGSCTCETHPVLFVVFLGTFASSMLGFIGFSTYVRERTERTTQPPGSERYTRLHPSQYKPFHSEHWGHR